MPAAPLPFLANTHDALLQAIRHHLRYTLGTTDGSATDRDRFMAVALGVRDRVTERMLETSARYERADAKRVYYLSMEFLVGRSLVNNLINLGLYGPIAEVLADFGVDLGSVVEVEADAALGNGGLGRLAACFLDSLATLDLPGFGYGINYQYGLFRQEIDNGQQRERPDSWLRLGSPWLIERPDRVVIIPAYGRIEHGTDRHGNYNPMWMDWKILIGVPHDMPVVGYGGRTVNYLRLYSARSSDEFDMRIFNSGDYVRAVEQKIQSETISKVLYPADQVREGKELRLLQEYFFVACAVRDIVNRYRKQHSTFDNFPKQIAIQLNDTHPALTVAELMRILVDEFDVQWDKAWGITQATCAYTNHTLMPEALERWPVPLMEKVLPRHLQIIQELNHRFLQSVRAAHPGDDALARDVSCIEEGGDKQIRMANLAILGSHSVNGVARLHSELVQTALMPHFKRVFPDRFNNKTNGVTPRRWIVAANPGLAGLIRESIGEEWITDLDRLRALEPCADDPAFRDRFQAIKRGNKVRLAQSILDLARVKVDPDSLFDIQAKRIHEYKRQLLNVLHIIHLYLAMVEDGVEPAAPRTFLFAGKAAPGYWTAKQIIQLVHSVAHVVNRDKRVRDRIKVAFLPDYRVTLAERIVPACDLSEQISTAGTEASGTGNMKFAMNGALTIGTLDGANIEILEEVGAENIIIFGKTAPEIADLRARDAYRPYEAYLGDARIRRVMDAIRANRFSADEPGLFAWVYAALVEGRDHYYLLADFAAYVDAHERASRLYLERSTWTRKAILNVARMGKFSSDRTIREYARDIWGIRPVPSDGSGQ